MSALVITKSLAIRATSPFRMRVIGAQQQSTTPARGFNSVVGRILETSDSRQEPGRRS